MMKTHLLAAYDAECPFCRSVADWVKERDVFGLVVFFPVQNPDLLRLAPELGGRPLDRAVHAVDSVSREVFSDGRAWLQMTLRLPRWRQPARIAITLGMSWAVQSLFERHRRDALARH